MQVILQNFDSGFIFKLFQAHHLTFFFFHFQFLILVIDSTDRERLSITKKELYSLLAHEELSRASLLVYANKQDVQGSMSPAEISSHLNLTGIKKHKWQIQACCALTGEGCVWTC